MIVLTRSLQFSRAVSKFYILVLDNRLLNATVHVGDHTDDVSRNQLAGIVHETYTNPIHIDVNPALEGRIVSVSKLMAKSPLTLCEVQVFGELVGTQFTFIAII